MLLLVEERRLAYTMPEGAPWLSLIIPRVDILDMCYGGMLCGLALMRGGVAHGALAARVKSTLQVEEDGGARSLQV